MRFRKIIPNILGVIALLMSALVVSSCWKRGGERWTEDVRLQNGEVILVQREFRYGDSGEASLSHGPLGWASMDFEYRGIKYHWEARYVWPKALQIDPEGRFYVVATIPYCHSWHALGEPKSYYWVMRFESGRWVVVPLQAIDVKTPFNLALNSLDKKHVSADDPKFGTDDQIRGMNSKIIPKINNDECQGRY